MEKLKKVTGSWRGTYHYEAAEKMPNLKPVPFRIFLKQGWFGHFTGRVNDDPILGMPETGRIDGYFSFPKIEFTKLMPMCRIAMPDGRSITLRESLIERGYPCDHDVPHRPIFYRGEFSDSRHAGDMDYRTRTIVVGRWQGNGNDRLERDLGNGSSNRC